MVLLVYFLNMDFQKSSVLSSQDWVERDRAFLDKCDWVNLGVEIEATNIYIIILFNYLYYSCKYIKSRLLSRRLFMYFMFR